MTSGVNAFGMLETRWNGSVAGRVWTRYAQAQGNVLAAGIAYFAFFSVFPALALGFTGLGLVLGDNSDLQADLARQVNTVLGGGATIIGLTPADGGLVTVDALVQTDRLTVSAVLGLAVLLYSGLGWLDAMRQGIRAVFGLPGDGNLLLTKLRDVGALVVFGLAVLVSAVGSVLVTTASNAVLRWLGLDGVTGAGTLVTVATAVALLAIDFVVFLLLFRFLSGVRAPLRDLRRGAVVGALAVALLKVFGGLLLGLLSANRFLAAFSVVVGLLVWLNLVGRITLLSAACAATDAEIAGTLVPVTGPAGSPAVGSPAVASQAVASQAVGAQVIGSHVVGSPVAGVPTYGVRAADRTTLAAGVVLGIASAGVAGVIRRALHTVVGAVHARTSADKQ